MPHGRRHRPRIDDLDNYYAFGDPTSLQGIQSLLLYVVAIFDIHGGVKYAILGRWRNVSYELTRGCLTDTPSCPRP